MKYPWGHGDNPDKKNKWGVYDTERNLYSWVRQINSLHTFAKSPEAAIMDWADDITYAVHDLVDFYCAGQIPLDRLADDNDPAERDSFFSEVFTRCQDLTPRRLALEKIFKEVLEYFPLDRRYIGTLEQRTGLWQFSTVLISRYVDAITLLMPTNELATLQHGQTQTVRIVFETMVSAAKDNHWKLFPPAYQEELEAAKGHSLLQARVVVDYVASTTEHEVARVYALLTGKS